MKAFKYILFATILLFTGCADDPGPKGDKGDVGEQEPNGETGSPNVIYSEWFALNTSSDKYAKYVSTTTSSLVYGLMSLLLHKMLSIKELY